MFESEQLTRSSETRLDLIQNKKSAGFATSFAQILDEQLMTGIPSKEEMFHQLLIHPCIVGVRSKGLMLAIEFADFIFNKRVIDRCIEKGIITDWFLHCDNSMRIAPPLIISETEIRKACEIILDAIRFCDNSPAPSQAIS